MILTTNRVTVFDEAVQSRIHLGIKYDQLSKKAKAEIWTAFIQQANKVSTTGEGGKLTPTQLGDLSKKEFNGRQVRTATTPDRKTFVLIGACRSRTRSAWPTLSQRQKASRSDTITSWRRLKRMKTLTTIFEVRDRLRTTRRMSRVSSVDLAPHYQTPNMWSRWKHSVLVVERVQYTGSLNRFDVGYKGHGVLCIECP